MNINDKCIKPKRPCPIVFQSLGATGPTGPTGPAGSGGNITLTIGTVTTGEPGSQAAASIMGTSPNFLLNLTIPVGPTGPTGATERLFKSSNKIIIDSSLIIPYNEKKIIYFTIFPKKCHFFFCNYFHNKTF